MAGLVPAIHVFLGDSRVEVLTLIAPVRIRGVGEARLPNARPGPFVMMYAQPPRIGAKAGLIPAFGKDVDGRDKPGHDGGGPLS